MFLRIHPWGCELPANGSQMVCPLVSLQISLQKVTIRASISYFLIGEKLLLG